MLSVCVLSTSDVFSSSLLLRSFFSGTHYPTTQSISGTRFFAAQLLLPKQIQFSSIVLNVAGKCLTSGATWWAIVEMLLQITSPGGAGAVRGWRRGAHVAALSQSRATNPYTRTHGTRSTPSELRRPGTDCQTPYPPYPESSVVLLRSSPCRAVAASTATAIVTPPHPSPAAPPLLFPVPAPLSAVRDVTSGVSSSAAADQTSSRCRSTRRWCELRSLPLVFLSVLFAVLLKVIFLFTFGSLSEISTA